MTGGIIITTSPPGTEAPLIFNQDIPLGRRNLQQAAIIDGKIERETFITSYLSDNYNVDVKGDFGEFVKDFKDGPDNDKVFSVFVPSKEAMVQLQFDVRTFSDRKEILKFFATFHVFAGDEVLQYDDLECGKTTVMSNNEKSSTVCKDRKKFQVGEANTALQPRIKFKFEDNFASNGILQVIDSVVLKPFPVTASPSQSPTKM